MNQALNMYIQWSWGALAPHEKVQSVTADVGSGDRAMTGGAGTQALAASWCLLTFGRLRLVAHLQLRDLKYVPVLLCAQCPQRRQEACGL